MLVDGDLQFGDVSVMLGLQSQNTVLDAAAAVQYGDIELVQTLADKDHGHRSAGAAGADRVDADRRAAARRDGEHLRRAAGRSPATW